MRVLVERLTGLRRYPTESLSDGLVLLMAMAVCILVMSALAFRTPGLQPGFKVSCCSDPGSYAAQSPRAFPDILYASQNANHLADDAEPSDGLASLLLRPSASRGFDATVALGSTPRAVVLNAFLARAPPVLTVTS